MVEVVVNRMKKQDIFDRVPVGDIERLADIVVENPMLDFNAIADLADMPEGIAFEIGRTARFSMLVLARSAQRMAARNVPRAVEVLGNLLDENDTSIPLSIRLSAAQTVVTWARPYLDRALGGGSVDERDLAEMDPDQLRAIIAAGEDRLSSMARDVTPGAPDSATIDVDSLPAHIKDLV